MQSAYSYYFYNQQDGNTYMYDNNGNAYQVNNADSMYYVPNENGQHEKNRSGFLEVP